MRLIRQNTPSSLAQRRPRDVAPVDYDVYCDSPISLIKAPEYVSKEI
jgi:hypothetical protein